MKEPFIEKGKGSKGRVRVHEHIGSCRICQIRDKSVSYASENLLNDLGCLQYDRFMQLGVKHLRHCFKAFP